MLDEKGEKVVRRPPRRRGPAGRRGLDEEVEKSLREQFDRGANLSLLVLSSWPRIGARNFSQRASRAHVRARLIEVNTIRRVECLDAEFQARSLRHREAALQGPSEIRH